MNIRYKVLAFLLIAGLAAAADVPPAADLVLTGATVYTAPGAKPITDAIVVVRDAKIVYVGKNDKKHTPRSARLLECSGKVIVAGFWNSHVHFTEDAWKDAAGAPADKLEAHMQEMLTRWGFTTVWDLGSDPQNTLALRKRVEAGEVPGPKILMAGDIFPLHGHPVYLPAELQLPEAATPEDALRMVRGYMYLGLDGTKLFTGYRIGPSERSGT